MKNTAIFMIAAALTLPAIANAGEMFFAIQDSPAKRIRSWGEAKAVTAALAEKMNCHIEFVPSAFEDRPDNESTSLNKYTFKVNSDNCAELEALPETYNAATGTRDEVERFGCPAGYHEADAVKFSVIPASGFQSSSDYCLAGAGGQKHR